MSRTVSVTVLPTTVTGLRSRGGLLPAGLCAGRFRGVGALVAGAEVAGAVAAAKVVAATSGAAARRGAARRAARRAVARFAAARRAAARRAAARRAALAGFFWAVLLVTDRLELARVLTARAFVGVADACVATVAAFFACPGACLLVVGAAASFFAWPGETLGALTGAADCGCSGAAAAT